MLIKKGILESKVKSITSQGEKAITRAFLYKEKDKNYTGLHHTMLYFTSEPDNQGAFIRKVGNKFLYKKEWTVKLSTVLETLLNLQILPGNFITGEQLNQLK